MLDTLERTPKICGARWDGTMRRNREAHVPGWNVECSLSSRAASYRAKDKEAEAHDAKGDVAEDNDLGCHAHLGLGRVAEPAEAQRHLRRWGGG